MERPILYSTPMIQAKLAGRKTQTRRIIKVQPDAQLFPAGSSKRWWSVDPANLKMPYFKCPYGEIDDLLWARETLIQNGELGLEYFADREAIDESLIPNDYGPYGGTYSFRNIPNIHMPKWAARIWELITGIRVERLQDISEEDAIAEGIEKFPEGYIFNNYLEDSVCHSAVESYRTLWESINGLGSWEVNPWCWCITTEVLSTTGRPKDL